MSRAFVKERDGEPSDDGLPELPVSSAPNYVTPKGLDDLKARLVAAQADVAAMEAAPEKAAARSSSARAKSELRRLQRRVDAAVLIKQDAGADGTIAIGARVTIEDADARRQTFTIVGEDQADPLNGFVSWTSPLGEALLGRRTGERTIWRRPAGDIEVSIVVAARPG